MRILPSALPDVQELMNVGDVYHDYGSYEKMVGCYRQVMQQATCPIVVASLTTDQTDGIKLLKENGFHAVSEPRENPNSGHMILLFVKRIPKAKEKK